MLRALRPLVFLLSLAFIAGIARDVRADNATAQALFDQAKKLMGEKKYAEACPKLEESQKLDPGLGTQTNLAICYESEGRTASAWSLYLEVASQAKATNQPDREKKARDAAKALEPKLSKLTIEVTSPADGIEVKRNGAAVGQATWGTPIPVDPGQVQLAATAPGRKAWEKGITVESKPGVQTVKIPELEKGEPPPPSTTTVVPAGTAPAVTGYYGSTPPPLPQGQRMKRRSGGLFGGGIAMICVGSIATIGGAAAAGIASLSDYGDTTPGAGVALVGLAMLGGGIAMVVVGGKKVPVKNGEDASNLTVSPMPEVRVGPTSASLKWKF
jgi:hypothetical protein